MSKILTFLALAIISLAAQARDLTIEWTAPQTFEDGSALDPATDLTEYRFYCESGQGATAAPTATSLVITDFQAGPCTLTATAVALDGTESVMSVPFLVAGLVPNPPSGLSATF